MMLMMLSNTPCATMTPRCAHLSLGSPAHHPGQLAQAATRHETKCFDVGVAASASHGEALVRGALGYISMVVPAGTIHLIITKLNGKNTVLGACHVWTNLFGYKLMVIN